MRRDRSEDTLPRLTLREGASANDAITKGVQGDGDVEFLSYTSSFGFASLPLHVRMLKSFAGESDVHNQAALYWGGNMQHQRP